MRHVLAGANLTPPMNHHGTAKKAQQRYQV